MLAHLVAMSRRRGWGLGEKGKLCGVEGLLYRRPGAPASGRLIGPPVSVPALTCSQS